VAIIFTCLIAGAALYFTSTKVAPGVATKGTSINAAITSAGVNATLGTVTGTAP
jgi:hypothetical protein